jgi:coenzyme F420 hydrogenase subunit beta
VPREPLRVVSARSAGVVWRGDPNSVIQALLVAARSSGLIDGAILLDVDPWSLAPAARIAATIDEIVAGAGMQFIWTPVLSRLNEAIFDLGLTRLAVVGAPCVAAAVRRLSGASACLSGASACLSGASACLMEAEERRLWPYRQALRVTLASFCTGMYMPGLVTGLLYEGMGIVPGSIHGLATREAEGVLRVFVWGSPPRDVPLTEVQAFTRRGCATCHDYLGESADLAIGHVGALPNHSTLITRSMAGEALVRNALGHGLLQIEAQADVTALDEARAAKDRRARAEAFAECRIVMLESLLDPKGRAEAKRRFASLYGARVGVARKEDGNGGCGGCSGGGC